MYFCNENLKKNDPCGFWKINKFIWNGKLITWLFIEQLFFWYFLNNFSALLLCRINVFDIFDIGDFFQTIVILQSTVILIESLLFGLKKFVDILI